MASIRMGLVAAVAMMVQLLLVVTILESPRGTRSPNVTLDVESIVTVELIFVIFTSKVSV